MALPSAGELRDIFAAAREFGVTHLRVGGLEVRLSVPQAVAGRLEEQPSATAILAGINAASPLPARDPIDVIKDTARDTQRRVMSDPLDILGRGGRLLDTDPADPTQLV
jgi:hypothetical protein